MVRSCLISAKDALSKLTHNLTLCLGFTISFGAFREYYFYNSAFEGNQVIAVTGVVSTVGTHFNSEKIIYPCSYLAGCDSNPLPCLGAFT